MSTARYAFTVTDERTTAPIAGMDIYVYDQATGAPAVMTDDLGQPLTNPLVTDTFGFAYFNAVQALYRADFILDGRLRYKETNIVVGDSNVVLKGAPPVAGRAGKFLAYDADGNPVAANGTGADNGLRTDLAATTGDQLVGTPWGSLFAILTRGIARTPLDFGAVSGADCTTALANWAASGEKLTMPKGNQVFFTDAPVELSIAGTCIDAKGSRATIAAGQRNPGRGVIEPRADNCIIDGLIVSNPDLLALATGAQFHGVLNRANNTRMMNMQVLDFEMGLTTNSGANPLGVAVEGEFYDAWYLFNFIRTYGMGPGTPDNGSGLGEDRGDGISHWGSRGVIIGNRLVPSTGRDCRGAIFCEQLNAFALVTTGVDNASMVSVMGNIIGTDQSGNGRYRKGIDLEEYSRGTVTGNVIRGVTWYGIQLTGGMKDATVTGNALLMDCPNTNQNGQSWNPARAGINIFPNGGNMSNIVVSDNAVRATAADYFRALIVQGRGAGGTVDALKIASNNFISEANTDKAAIVITDLAAGNSISIEGNSIFGRWDKGIFSSSADAIWIKDNDLSGFDSLGLDINDVDGTAYMSSNTFVGGASSVQTVGVAEAVITNNTFDGPSSFCIVNAGTTTLDVVGNIAPAGSGLFGDFGTATVRRWKGNSGFSYLTATSPYDPASIASGAVGGVSGNITVTGAAAGDTVTAKWSAVTQGLVPLAAVSASNTVIASFVNPTAGAVDLPSGTMTVIAERG